MLVRSTSRVRFCAVCFVLATGMLLAAISLTVSGCGDASPRPAAPAPSVEKREAFGVEAIPAGYALLIEGKPVSAEYGSDQRIEAVIVPEEGLFRIELLGDTSPAEMSVTVRTPEKQLGLRSQAVLEGQPHPLSMAFLDSPLAYPTGSVVVEELRWEGNRCKGVLGIVVKGSRAIDKGTYEAEIDPETGIVIWEKQNWTPYLDMGMEITRRLVPVDEVEKPRADEVIERAQKDWMELLLEANDGAFPVFGLDFEGIVLHTLQIYEGKCWVRYSTEAQPGRIAGEMYEGRSDTSEPLSEAERADLTGAWAPRSSDDGQTKGWGHLFFVTADRPDTGESRTRAVELTIYDWALEELGIALDDVEAALAPLTVPAYPADIVVPHLMFEDRMPLPAGADFGGTLSGEYRLYGG